MTYEIIILKYVKINMTCYIFNTYNYFLFYILSLLYENKIIKCIVYCLYGRYDVIKKVWLYRIIYSKYKVKNHHFTI